MVGERILTFKWRLGWQVRCLQLKRGVVRLHGTMHHLALRIVVLLSLGAMLSCTDHVADDAATIEIRALDTLVTQESEILGNAGEMTVGPAGQIFITGARAGYIIRLHPDGTVDTTIGRLGSGPGEFRFPRSTHVGPDFIRILDGGNARIQILDLDGRFIRTSPAPPAATSGAVSFSRTGDYVVALNGQDSALAQRFGPLGEPGSRLGAPVVPPEAVWDMPRIKADIADGLVPAQLRNLTLPILEDDGAVWLILLAEGVVQRFTAQDSLEWSVALSEPEFAVIKEEFFQRNRADANPSRFTPLSYVVTARPHETGLLMLLRMPDGSGTVLLNLDRSGHVAHRIRIPTAHGVRAFAIDPKRRSLYLVAYYDAILLRAELPTALRKG